MTHYDIDYGKLGVQEKHDKAIQDIKDYLGDERFETITKILRDGEPMPYRKFKMALFMSGVQGYPLVAWHNHAYGLPAGTVEE